MELSRFTDYSLRTLMTLAYIESEKQNLTSVAEIATIHGISRNHLVKVVHKLVGLGYIQSIRGRGGGVSLAKPPHEINIGRVVEETENLGLLECFPGRDNRCKLNGGCALKSLMREAQAAFLRVLKEATLADLMNTGGTMQELVGSR